MNASRFDASSSAATGRDRDETVRLSSAELEAVLLRAGARLVARHEHGDFLEVRRRLLFLRHAAFVAGAELEDAMRTAALDPAHLLALLAVLRGGASPPGPPTPRR